MHHLFVIRNTNFLLYVIWYVNTLVNNLVNLFQGYYKLYSILSVLKNLMFFKSRNILPKNFLTRLLKTSYFREYSMCHLVNGDAVENSTLSCDLFLIKVFVFPGGLHVMNLYRGWAVRVLSV